jgi:hypothetical protein
MAASPEELAKGVKMAEQEMDYRVDLFNRYFGGLAETAFIQVHEQRVTATVKEMLNIA